MNYQRDYEKTVSRSIFISLGYILTMMILIACDTSATPKNQTSEGTCKSGFLDQYNKILSTKYSPQDTKAEDIKKTCESFLKTYSKTGEDCTAHNPADGSSTNLNVKDVRAICAQKLQGSYY